MMPPVEAAPDVEVPERPTALPPPDPVAIHRVLDALEEASSLSAIVLDRIDAMIEHLLRMQQLAEAVADEPGTVEARAEVNREIRRLAGELEAIAETTTYQNVPVLEGGVYRFEGQDGHPLELVIPNLRARGEGSLGLFEDVDATLLRVGPGGPIVAGHEVAVPEPLFGAQKTNPLAEGTYIAELTYLSGDASIARLRLLPEGSNTPLVTVEEIDLSSRSERLEADLGVGLTLILSRIPPGTHVKVGLTTQQTLIWRREVGRRLDSVEGYFHETTQPRDFELYAMFLEGPLEAARTAREQVTEFDERIRDELEGVLDRLGPARLDAAQLGRVLGPGQVGWSVIDVEGLKDALMEEL